MSKMRVLPLSTVSGKIVVSRYVDSLVYHIVRHAKFRHKVRFTDEAKATLRELLSNDRATIVPLPSQDEPVILRMRDAAAKLPPIETRVIRFESAVRGTKNNARDEAKRLVNEGFRLLRSFVGDLRFEGDLIDRRHVLAYAACAGGPASWPKKRDPEMLAA